MCVMNQYNHYNLNIVTVMLPFWIFLLRNGTIIPFDLINLLFLFKWFKYNGTI